MQHDDDYLDRLIDAVEDECGMGAGAWDTINPRSIARAFLEASGMSRFVAATEKMLANEQCGGDGWWDGYEMLKAALAFSEAIADREID